MLSIGVVARQTGIEIGTLRKWEQRYGFPRPVRLESGQRRYLDRDVENLLVVARRLACGERLGQVIRDFNEAVDTSKIVLVTQSEDESGQKLIESALGALINHDLAALRTILEDALSARSMAGFVEEVAGPLTRQVGEYWAGGDLPIYAEHLYSAVLDSILVRETSRHEPAGVQPSVLLTTPAGEPHTLGLSMVNAVLAEAGIASLRLHGGLPVCEIAAAVDAYRIKVVGVSATCLYPPKILSASMKALRDALSPRVKLWFGGAGVRKVCHLPPGVTTFASMYELKHACETLDLSDDHDLETEKAAR
jgi:DNA-binding transcriptional MerR regulator